MKTKQMLMLDQILHKNLLYNTFVLLPMIEQNNMIHDTEVEVHHEINITVKITIHKIDIVLHLEIDLVMTRILLPHKTHDHDTTIIKDIRDPIAHLTDPHTDPRIDVTLVTDIDHVRIQEITTILQGTELPLDHHHDQQILDLLDPVHIPIQETNSIHNTHKLKMIQITSKYTCITQLK